MKILLAAGVQHDGRVGTIFSDSVTPLEYAIENRQDEAILLLLDTDSVTNQMQDSVLEKVMSYDYEPWSPIVTATIEAMVRRSNRLRTLAIAHLSQRELDRLCISNKGEPIQILDAYAAPTANALKKVGVKLPEALQSNPAYATVYHGPFYFYYHSPELADRLWSSGFYDTNVCDKDGFTPLYLACLKRNLGMVSWLMSHGGDPTTVSRGHSLNAFHLLSHGFRRSVPEIFSNLMDGTVILDGLFAHWLPHRDVFTRIVSLCGTSCRDDCRCACSPQGCTPTTILLRKALHRWYWKKSLFLSWCRLIDLSADAIETCCLEFARVETFERLGITHVCCEIQPLYGIDTMPQDTIEEIQDEESEMIDQLETWMTLYEEERAKFEGSAIQFLDKWSDILKDELDVPAPFEEKWRWIYGRDKERHWPDYFTKDCMSDYFTEPSCVEQGHEVMDEDQDCMSNS